MPSTYLTRTNGSAVTAERRTFTISYWVKRCNVGVQHALCSAGNGGGAEEFTMRFQTDDTLEVWHYDGSFVGRKRTNRKFRDTNAWYHVFCQYDTTNSTADDRIKLYINGVRETSFQTSINPTLNDNTPWNVDERHQIGSNSWAGGGASSPLDGYMSHFYNVAGSIIDISQFGSTDSTTGEWKINTSPTIASYGTAGFLILKDGNTVTDQSPNSNNFTASGTLTKTEDCPSNVFATMNPFSQKDPTVVYGNGNTKTFYNQTSTFAVYSTLAASSGKYYAECEIDAVGSASSVGVISVDTANLRQYSQDFIGQQTDSIGYLQNGEIKKANSNQQTGLTSFSNGTIVGIAMDLDNNTVQFYINGASTGNTVSLTADKFYYFGDAGHSDAGHLWNFGNGYFGTTEITTNTGTGFQDADGNGRFFYAVPTNYRCLSTKGLNQ